MTAIQSPAQNTYFTRDLAQVAKEKYSNATWNNAYGYITLVAFAALALVANLYLFPLVHPATLIVIDGVLAAFGYTQVWPKVDEWFKKAEKFTAQGDKELQIRAKTEVFRSMSHENLFSQYCGYGINTDRLPQDASLNQHPSVALLARMMWHDKRAVDLLNAEIQLKAENKFKEALTTGLSSNKASIKSCFFAYLIDHSHHQGKFKDSFAWVEMPVEERALAACFDSPNARRLAQTREPTPRFFCADDFKDTYPPTIRKLEALLTPQPATT